MSPGFKSSLAALAVAGLLFAPVMGTNVAYADDTSTNTVQTDSSSQDAAAKAAADKKADDAKKQAEADAAAAKQKADEEAAAVKAKAEKEAADKAAAEAQAKADAEKAQKEADAKKAADEASAKAEVTPSGDASPTAPADPPSQEAAPASSSPSPTAQVAAKVASTKVVAFDPVKNYVTEIVGCAASGVDIKAGAPDLKVKGPGDADAATYKAGDELRWNTSASSIDVYLAIADDSSNNTTLTIAVKQGEECKTEVTPSGTTQVGNVVTVPNDNGVIYRDQDGKYLEPGDYTLTADNPTLIVKAEPDQFFKLPAGDWTWTHKYQAPDADGDGYTDAEEQAAGSDPNDPKSTPVDLDGDGVLNDADKCANTAANAKVNADGCSADQLGTQPDETFPQDPKYNNASYWETYFGDGAYCIKYDPASTPFTVPSAPAGYNWFSAIVKAGAGDAANELYNGIKPGDQLVHSSGKDISHVILCKRAVTVKKHYAVVIWSVNDYPTNSMWPQTLVDSVTGLDAPNLGYFDSLLKGKCVKLQVDVYHYDVADGSKAKVDNLIAGGHLYGSNNPPEPLINGGEGTAWKFYSNSDCTTYYDVPTIRVWDQLCVVGDQGVGQYTDGGFAVSASDKVSVKVTDSDDKVVTDPSHVKPGVYSVFATAPKGGAWNELPDGWSYVDKTKTTIKTVVTVNAAKDCSVLPPPPIKVPKSDTKSDCYGVYDRTWNEVQRPVWNGKGWDYAAPVVEDDTGWVLTRALTNDEWWAMGCYPMQPKDVTVPMRDTKSDCYGHYLRTWELFTTYKWVWSEEAVNGRGSWVAQPTVVQNDTDWVLQSVLTNDEWWNMGCAPVQPPNEVKETPEYGVSCAGWYYRIITETTTYAWVWADGESEVRGSWEPTVTTVVGDWIFQDKLTSGEKADLGCTKNDVPTEDDGDSPLVPAPALHVTMQEQQRNIAMITLWGIVAVAAAGVGIWRLRRS